MCQHSEIVTLVTGEEVVSVVMGNKLSIKDLITRGLDLQTLTSTPNWVMLTDDKNYAIQILDCTSSMSDEALSKSLKTVIARCNSTLQKIQAPAPQKVTELVTVGVRV